MKRVLLGAASVLLALGGFWLHHALFPGDVDRIRRLLREAAKTAAVEAGETSFARMVRANKLAYFFTPDVVINLEGVRADLVNIEGRDQLLEVILSARANLRQLRLELLGISVEVNPGATNAEAYTTAIAEVDGEKDAILQELRIALRKTGRQWLMAGVNTIHTLGRPGPATPE